MLFRSAEMRLDDRLLDDWAAYGAQVFGGICVLVGGTSVNSFVMKQRVGLCLSFSRLKMM